MSAWDIAGAVVATPMALLLIGGFIAHLSVDGIAETEWRAVAVALGVVVWSAYCLARLFGAHA